MNPLHNPLPNDLRLGPGGSGVRISDSKYLDLLKDSARLRWIIENCEVSTEYYQIESLEQIDKLMEASKR